jgi:hypothetical protein
VQYHPEAGPGPHDSRGLIEQFLADRGYRDFRYTPFEIDIDLPKPQKKVMGTYTEKLADGRRLQISGPLLMTWHFISARRGDFSPSP